MEKTNLFTDTPSSNAETAALRKFMFERSFDGTPGTRVPERKPITLKPEQFDALKKEAYDAGFAAGQKAGLDEQTAQLMALVNHVGAKIDHVMATLPNLQKDNETHIRRLALALTKKFLPELTSRHGLAEIEALISGVIGEMVHEPRLVVRVHESQFDMLNEKVTAIATQKAYTGKIVMLADAEISMGDCRVEWADGGMERNTEATLGALEHIVAP